MKELTAKQEQFYSRWKRHRKNKWRYILFHGSMRWTLAAIIIYLWNINFELAGIVPSKLISGVILFAIGGAFMGLRQFKNIDNIYLSFDDSEDIKKGMELIQSGQTWQYENFKLSKQKDDSIVIRNDLYWFKENSNEKLNEFTNIMIADFQRMKRNKIFTDYIKQRKIILQIFDNSGNESPILEKALTE